jgi:hypothetical protein
MAGVYSELRGFALAHRGCASPRHADVDSLTPNGYRLLVKCGCGVEFKRWWRRRMRSRTCCGRRC